METKILYTLKQCKADMLLLWGFLRDNPSFIFKDDAIRNMPIPDKEKDRLYELDSLCPCCEYSSQFFNEEVETVFCENCPIWYKDHENHNCIDNYLENKKGEYEQWVRSHGEYDRSKAAGAIYDLALMIDVGEGEEDENN